MYIIVLQYSNLLDDNQWWFPKYSILGQDAEKYWQFSTIWAWLPTVCGQSQWQYIVAKLTNLRPKFSKIVNITTSRSQVNLAISKWFSGEMAAGTYLTNSVTKPRSFIHINLPISIICLHLNPNTALSTAFVFLTISSTPPFTSPPTSFPLHTRKSYNDPIRGQ